ncbi:MAG: molybdenum cofactor guanylyltransferase [Armatimonadota bacterium]|nr:molybdenum cofactor guanylyltransferase [Armatimonadota bacterium]
MAPAVTGVVLAGGDSHRMGRDKAFLEFAGLPLVRHVIEALRPACVDLMVVTKTPLRYASLGVRVVTDADPRRAALVGLCTGLRAVATPLAFVAACDLPHLSAGVVTWMTSLARGYDAVVPWAGGRWHPLHAVYATSALAALERRLAAGGLRMSEVLGELRVRRIEEAELAVLSPGLETLRNINTPEDYSSLKAHGAGRTPKSGTDPIPS